jgi:flotillin
MNIPILAQVLFDFGLVLPILVVLVVVSILLYVVRQYKRCPSNRILVIFGKVGGQQTARCVHGGGVFIVPLFQDYRFLSLEPVAIDINLTGALSKKNIRANVPSTFTIGVSTDPAIMNNAAKRLQGLAETEIAAQARDIILGQMRLVIATLSIEEINQDREKFLDLVNKFCSSELLKIGLEVINVNIRDIRDITDESGYVDAIDKKAAAEAIQIAKVEVAQQEKDGAIGEANANRERTVEVANHESASSIGRKEAELEQRIQVAKLEAEGVSGEAETSREQDVVTAQQTALTEEGTKLALKNQRVRVATLEAEAVEGENESQASIAASNATLSERQAEARRRGDVARAEADRDVFIAEKDQELTRLQKEDIVHQEIDRQRIEIEAKVYSVFSRRRPRAMRNCWLFALSDRIWPQRCW